VHCPRRVLEFRRGAKPMTLWDVAFVQPLAEVRLEYVRVTYAAVVFLLCLSRSYGQFFADSEALLYQSRVPGFSRAWRWWRGATALIALLVAAGLGPSRALTAVLVLLFLAQDRYVAAFSPRLWNNVFNVHAFGVLLVLADSSAKFSSDPLAIQSFALTAMQLQVGLIYLLAGLSKLRKSGWRWFWGGKTIHSATLFRGTPLGRAVTARPLGRRAIGVFTLVLELFVPFLLLFPALAPVFVILSLGFHLGTYLTLRISFWQLWIFYPALFILGVLA